MEREITTAENCSSKVGLLLWETDDKMQSSLELIVLQEGCGIVWDFGLEKPLTDGSNAWWTILMGTRKTKFDRKAGMVFQVIFYMQTIACEQDI